MLLVSSVFFEKNPADCLRKRRVLKPYGSLGFRSSTKTLSTKLHENTRKKQRKSVKLVAKVAFL